MAEATGIEWTDATFNPWTGCLAVSPGCDHCYAAALSRRAGATFGSFEPGADRKRTSVSYWNGPLRWNRKAEAAGKRMRVFCASMADVFDNRAPAEWRADLWRLIAATPMLDWQLLTKRPQNIAKMLPADWGPRGWPNVWLGTTAEDQERLDQRWPVLRAVPAALRFLSCEPLIGRVDLDAALKDGGLGWVIAGGESGPGFRAVDVAWMRTLRSQCADAGVPFFGKQMSGARKPLPPLPADLMVKEFPMSCAVGRAPQ